MSQPFQNFKKEEQNVFGSSNPLPSSNISAQQSGSSTSGARLFGSGPKQQSDKTDNQQATDIFNSKKVQSVNPLPSQSNVPENQQPQNLIPQSTPSVPNPFVKKRQPEAQKREEKPVKEKSPPKQEDQIKRLNKSKVPIKDSTQLQKNIQEADKLIENCNQQGDKIRKELNLIEQEDAKITKDIKKKTNRVKYLQDNKAGDPVFDRELATLKEQLQNHKSRLAQVRQKKNELQKRKEDLQANELNYETNKYKWEEHLAQMQLYNKLQEEVSQKSKQIQENIKTYQQMVQEFPKKYQESNEKIRIFLFQNLRKQAQEGKKLFRQRNQLNEKVKASQFADCIKTDESTYDYEVDNFTGAQTYCDYCKHLNQAEKQGEVVEVSDKRKLILLRLLEDDPEYKEVYEKMEMIKLDEAYQRLLQRKKEKQEQQRKAEETRKTKEQEQIVRKQKEQEEKKTQQEKQAKQGQYQKEYQKVQKLSKDITQQVDDIKGLKSLNSDAFQQFYEKKGKNLKNLQNKTSKLKQQLAQLSKLAGGIGKIKQIQPLKAKMSQWESFIRGEQSNILEELKSKRDEKQKAQQKLQKERIEKEQREQEQQRIRNIVPEQPVRPNSKMLPFYLDKLAVAQASQRIGPQSVRFMSIQVQYLNQLRILIQLSNIEEQELLNNNFDRNKYQQLVSEKTTLFHKAKLPQQLTEEKLNQKENQQLMTSIEGIQKKIDPLQVNFSEEHIKGLYKFPKDVLMKTKQELFQMAIEKQVKENQEDLAKLKQETLKMKEELTKKQALKKKLEEQKIAYERSKEKTLQDAKQRLQRQFLLPIEKKDKLLDENAYQSVYNVIVQNEEDLKKNYQQLNDDSELQAIKDKLQNVIKEREREKQHFMQVNEEYLREVRQSKNKPKREVNLGDYRKVKSDPRVQRLEADLKRLKQEWVQVVQKKKRIRASQVQGSQLRVMSYIDEY